MKQLYKVLFLFLTASLPSCKKYIQQQEKNAILQIMTTGVWYVTEYKQNSTDITSTFSGYVFKFDANGTVTGIKGGVSTTGSWSANISALTISSDFPGAGDPLKELNETWKITDSGPDYVVANSTDSTNQTTNNLELVKQ
jgi:hypothetical protein